MTSDPMRRPYARTIVTMICRLKSGDSEKLHSFSGGAQDWSPANQTPLRPRRGERLFDGGAIGRTTPGCGNDAIIMLLEELARRLLTELSGSTRGNVDFAVSEACLRLADDMRSGARTYPNSVQGHAEVAKDRTARAIEFLGSRGGGQRFSSNDLVGDVRMVVDSPLPQGVLPETQLCVCCVDALLACGESFPGLRFEVRNMADERLF